MRVLDEKKEGLGVMSTSEALKMAMEQDVDLILINPDAQPPLVRLAPLSKLKYEQKQKEKDQRKKQRESRYCIAPDCCSSSLRSFSCRSMWSGLGWVQLHAETSLQGKEHFLVSFDLWLNYGADLKINKLWAGQCLRFARKGDFQGLPSAI